MENILNFQLEFIILNSYPYVYTKSQSVSHFLSQNIIRMAEMNYVIAETPEYDSEGDEGRSESIGSITLPLNESINSFDDHLDVDDSILRGKYLLNYCNKRSL